MDQKTIIDIFNYSLKELDDSDIIITRCDYQIIDIFIELAIQFKNNNKLDTLSLKLFDMDIYKLKDLIFIFNIETISELRLFIKNIYIELNNTNYDILKILTLFNIEPINVEVYDFIQNTSNSYFINLFLFNFITILPISKYYSLLEGLTFNSEITNININLISKYLINFYPDDTIYLFFNILTYTQPILKDELFLLFLNNYNNIITYNTKSSTNTNIYEINYFSEKFNYFYDDYNESLLHKYFEYYDNYFYKKDDTINVLLYVALQSHTITYNCIDIILEHSSVINVINILQIFENDDISINIFELILSKVKYIYEQLERFNNVKNYIFDDINIQKCEILESFLMNDTEDLINSFKINKDKASFDIICYKIKNTNSSYLIDKIFKELNNLNTEETYLLLNNFTSNNKLIYVDLYKIDEFLEKSKLEISPEEAYILICNILKYMNSNINYKILDLFLKYLSIYFTYDNDTDSNVYQIVEGIETLEFDPIQKYFDVNNSQKTNKFLVKALYSDFDTYNCIEILLKDCNTINILNIIKIFTHKKISVNVLQLLLDNIDRKNEVLYNQLVKLGCFQLMCEMFSNGNYEKLPDNYEHYLKYLSENKIINKIDILDTLDPIDNSTLFEKFNVLNEYLSYNIPDFKSSGTCV